MRQFRDGGKAALENVVKYVTPELAYVPEIERGKSKVGGREDMAPSALRVTMVLDPKTVPGR